MKATAYKNYKQQIIIIIIIYSCYVLLFELCLYVFTWASTSDEITTCLIHYLSKIKIKKYEYISALTVNYVSDFLINQKL